MSRVAYTLLLLLGLAALLASGVSVSNYVNSVRSISRLALEITDLQFIDDDNPRVIIHFRLHNRSSLAIQVKEFFFELSFNEERVGGSNSLYRGTDPNVDPAVYSRASSIEQTLAPQGYLDLTFTLYIFSVQQDIIRHGEQSGLQSWSVNAGFRLIFPHTREERLIRMRASYGK